ncbi:transducin family protein / WD-40 repeat family protein [Artemisia annua]|uniref:Transducin family protein / WD-40 repeat family protein n=1 Tax=Artemisia annua TaxID=35608 RepID=A0A2U1N6G5_ARTAN|nr:transducin family protein / WD-40 repeat family protein [Artemisia annua]
MVAKLYVGIQSGTMLLYSWGFFKDCSDRFTALSPNPMNSLLKLDEDRVIVGSENDLIGLVGILPNRVIQPIGEHLDLPVDRLAFSHDTKFLGSISHDSTLKLWDIHSIVQDSGKTRESKSGADSDKDDIDMDTDDRLRKSSDGTKTKNKGGAQGLDIRSNFFADLKFMFLDITEHVQNMTTTQSGLGHIYVLFN